MDESPVSDETWEKHSTSDHFNDFGYKVIIPWLCDCMSPTKK